MYIFGHSVTDRNVFSVHFVTRSRTFIYSYNFLAFNYTFIVRAGVRVRTSFSTTSRVPVWLWCFAIEEEQSRSECGPRRNTRAAAGGFRTVEYFHAHVVKTEKNKRAIGGV